MILQALYDYYQRKASDPECRIAPQGYEWKPIPFIIIIDKYGNFINLEDTRDGEGKKRQAKQFLVIKSRSRTGSRSWATSNILWDHYGYILDYPKDQLQRTIENTNKQHKTFIGLVEILCDRFPRNEHFQAVKKFLDKQQKASVFEHDLWKECVKIPGCNFSFRIAGESNIIAEHPDLKQLAFEDTEEEEITTDQKKEGICLITGEKAEIAVLHTATAIRGGKSGAKLVGFQKNAGYDSYYKSQGNNAPVSIKAESAYTTALNVLLSRESNNKFNIGDLTIIFWATRSNDFETQFPFFFSAPEKDQPERNIQEVRSFLNSIYSDKLNAESTTDFHILGLYPNAARISVRFWRIGKVVEFADKIARHFEDLDVIKNRNDDRDFLTLFNLLANISFEHKIENVPPGLSSKIIESILDGTPYPQTMQQQCIRRIRADVSEKSNINRIRVSILKAYLNRKYRIIPSNEKPMTMAIDLENHNQGYLCGRLFAILEKIQEEAQPNINTTIRERFYGAASSTPITVFGRLINLTGHHLSKLQPGRQTNLNKLIQEVMEKISSNGMPAHLTLDDQSRFAIGYYHQRQDLFTKKENIN